MISQYCGVPTALPISCIQKQNKGISVMLTVLKGIVFLLHLYYEAGAHTMIFVSLPAFILLLQQIT